MFLPIKDGSLSDGVAVIIIAGGRRTQLIDEQVLPSAREFEEVLVVGAHHAGDGFRYLHVPDMMKNTNDALLKRDIGTLATNAEWVLYLSDDHALGAGARQWVSILPIEKFDVCVPGRFCVSDNTIRRLNMGMGDFPDPNAPYCGGHGGLFRRSLIQQRPWGTMPHDRLWDVLASREQRATGARFAYSPFLVLQDLEPEAKPWQ